MDTYRSLIPSFTNERLNKILKSFYDKKLNVASYDEFTETIRDEKKNRDIETIIKETKRELKGLAESLEVSIKQITKEIDSVAYPNLSKDLTLTGEKKYGAIEFQNALEIAQMKPDNIHQILKTAIEHKRFDFVFTTLELLMNQKDLPIHYKQKIETIHKELYKMVGFDEKNKKKEQLNFELLECRDQIKLIEDSPEKFEANVMSSIRVAGAMKKAGQLEGETILLK